MNDRAPCPVCGQVMKAKLSWVDRCDRCRFLRSNLSPGPGTGIDGLEPLRRSNFERILDRIEELRPLAGTRLLEIGSAWGWFLEAAARRGVMGHGIEGERINAEKTKTSGLSVEFGLFPNDLVDLGPYDFIIFNDVFEHIPDPENLCKKLEQLLSLDGLLIINIPSTDGAMFRLSEFLYKIGIRDPYERLWQKDFASPHISMFNHANLTQMFHRHSNLREETTFSLPYVIRDGLGDRIRSSHGGAVGAVMLAGVWALTFVLPLLPADAIVVMFRVPNSA